MKKYKNILFLLFGLLLINLFVNKFDVRWDMTQNHRFTLSNASAKVLKQVKEPIQVLVFLEGDFPSYFKRLRNETEHLLQDFNNINTNIDYVFINPNTKTEDYIKGLIQKGLQPATLSVQQSGKLEQITIFPWAIIKQGKKEIPVSLLDKSYANTTEKQIQKSIESLEYQMVNGISQVQSIKNKKIAVIKGKGELDDAHIYSFLKTLGEKYRLAAFTLDSVKTQPDKTLTELQNYDLAILAKPTKRFNDKEKFVLDQFLMKGGRILWMTDAIKAHKDTLMYHGKTYALNAEMNVTDMFFSYGIRIKSVLVKDLIAAPVVLKVGQVGNKPQLKQFPWFYSPLASPVQKHLIGKNLDMVMLDFASPIELLKNNIKKTVLLTSSPRTDLVGVPTEINFDEIGKKPDIQQYNKGVQIFGVLLEGNFKSLFQHRLKPINLPNIKEQGTSAMIVISDGDIVKNQLDKGNPLPLGFDKWSKMTYDNQQFLLNAVDYLMDKKGVISLKNKEITLPLLDKNSLVVSLRKWQLINTIFPLTLIGILGFGVYYLRKKKYAK